MRRGWRRLRTGVLVCLVLNLAVLFAFTLPRAAAGRSLASRATTLREEIAREQKRADLVQRRNEVIAGNTADRARFYAELVGDRKVQLVPLLQELRQAASDLGLRMERQSYSLDPLEGVPITRFEIRLPLTGTYAQLGSFLDRLERSPRFLTVDRVSLREVGQGGQAVLEVSVSAYFRQEPEDVAATRR